MTAPPRFSRAIIAFSALCGCSNDADIAYDEPADFRGTYSVTVTNGINGCGFPSWDVGQSAPNIGVVITQNEADASVEVQGGSGILLALLHGTNVYKGRAAGDQLKLWIDGTIPTTQGNCTYTWSNDAVVILEGDYIEGKLTYSRAHNNNPDCDALICETIQELNGTRPP